MRDLTREAQQHARRRLRRRALPGTLLFLVLALAFLPFAGREPAMGVVGAVLLATVLATSTAAVLRHPRRGPVLRETLVEGSPATVLSRPAGGFWAGLAVLGALALLPGAAAWGLGAGGNTLGAVIAGAVALAVASPLLAALAGRYVAGEVVLTAHGLRYRHLGLESTAAWEDLVDVLVDEASSEVRLRPSHPTRTRHRHRAGPVRGQHADPSGVLVLQVREWGLLATDVGRLVLHYAGTPADRTELGTPAARERLRRLTGLPVERRHDAWLVGRDTGLRTYAFDEQDVATPVWVDSAHDTATSALLEMYRYRGMFAAGLLGLGLVITALALMPGAPGFVAAAGLVVASGGGMGLVFTSPKRPDLAAAGDSGLVDRLDGVVLRRAPLRHRLVATACAGTGVALSAVVVHSAGAWPVPATVVTSLLAAALLVPALLAATGRSAAGELVLDEAGLAYRAGRAAWSVGWSELARVDAMWDGVVRLERHDRTTLRLDVAGMPAHPYPVAELLTTYVRSGGPRGDTRSVETVRRRLRDGI